MDIVLVDTSVWINFLRAKETDASLFLKHNLSNIIVVTCPTIIQEILQGVGSESEWKTVNAYFNTLTKLIEEPYGMAEQATALYNTLRRLGVTVRKPNDC